MTLDTSSTRPLALVTGASSGIGYEIARALARREHDLVIAAEDTARLARAAHAIAAEFPDAVVAAIAADLSHADGPQHLYAEVARLQRPVEVLVNNAGVGVWGPFADGTNLNKELAMVQLNAASPVQLTKKILPGMMARRRGRLLFTSSIAAITATPLAAVYGATKSFVFSFAEGLRDELRGSGVTVTALMPGATDTNWFQRAGAAATRTAQGTLADPREVAEAGVEAMLRGDDHVVTPFKDRLQAVLGKFMTPAALAHQGRFE